MPKSLLASDEELSFFAKDNAVSGFVLVYDVAITEHAILVEFIYGRRTRCAYAPRGEKIIIYRFPGGV